MKTAKDYLDEANAVVKKIDFDIDNTERSSIVYDPIWKQFELRNVERCCVGD